MKPSKRWRKLSMKKLFTNKLLIHANEVVVKKLLLDIDSLAKWNPAIHEIKFIGSRKISIHRNQAAININELITIESTTDQVIFDSIGGKLEYKLIFDLDNEQDYTMVRESFYLHDETNLFFPLSLLAPVAKHDFNQNLIALSNLSESIS